MKIDENPDKIQSLDTVGTGSMLEPTLETINAIGRPGGGDAAGANAGGAGPASGGRSRDGGACRSRRCRRLCAAWAATAGRCSFWRSP